MGAAADKSRRVFSAFRSYPLANAKAKASCHTGGGWGSTFTSFARRSVLAVLGTVSLHHLPLAVIPLNGERHAEDVVARLDDAQDAPHTVPLLLGALPGPQVLDQLVLHDGDTAVEETLDHLEEVGVVGLVRCIGVVADSHQG